MDNKYLIVSDLDGTLLKDHDYVSEFNIEAVRKVVKAGHIFCIATGRAWSETKAIYESVGIDTVVVTSNGSHIHSPSNCGFKSIITPVGKVVANKILSNKWISDNIIAFSSPTETNITFYNFREELVAQSKYKYIERIFVDKCEVNEESMSLILMVDKDIDLETFRKELYSISDQISHSEWSMKEVPDYIFLKITSSKSKEDGVRALSQYYNIPQERIITFGDEMNDLQMTKFAGTGYAMNNAHEGLKKVADEVLDKQNYEHGVGHKMLELIKKWEG